MFGVPWAGAVIVVVIGVLTARGSLGGGSEAEPVSAVGAGSASGFGRGSYQVQRSMFIRNGTRILTAQTGALSSVVALGANICNKIPGLAPKQRAICRSRPVAMAVIGEGAKIGISECQFQFQNMRWNCTLTSKYDSFFGYQHDIASKEAAFWSAISSSGVVYAITQACSVGSLDGCGCDKTRLETKEVPRENTIFHASKEAAFWSAISSSGVVYAITQACSVGSLDGCGCDKTRLETKEVPRGWKWGGCSADIRHGLKLARKFLDAREIEETERSLMNIHNNKAGRKAVRDNMGTECRCHGTSGSCTMKTCWRRLPPFRKIGDFLYQQYHKSKHVDAWRSNRLRRPRFLFLSRRPTTKPRRRDLVYLEKSPNYCEYNVKTGSVGTVGRQCNKGSSGNDGCDLMCCGRGYNTHQYTKTWQCNCTFHWCCQVNCKNCTEKRLEYTCK